jgi:FeS assembly protein IscX
MTWNDAEHLGIARYEKVPDSDPLTVRFTDLRKMILDLEDFDDEADQSTEPKLEAIQMAWHEEFEDGQ